MVTEILILKGKSGRESEKDVLDLKKVHELRGRIIHCMSIIELIMKQYCGETKSRKNIRTNEGFVYTKINRKQA